MPSGDRVWLRRCLLLLACAWPLSLHYAILFAAPDWPARINAAAAAAGVLIWAIAAGSLGAGILAAALIAILFGTLVLSPRLLLFAPPVLINAALGAVFAASLRPGRTPVICIFASLEHGELPADLARHARLITWFWALLLAAIGIISLLLAALAPMETWSLFVNVVSYAMIATLFTGEYLYRRLRFRHYPHASLPAVIRNVRRANLFARR
ncbi:MAG TPA: hypothetical protein VMJ14_14655 [Burkholderiales bacterium]|nr:hypothetical protein [Burkholderiales bacterium]